MTRPHRQHRRRTGAAVLLAVLLAGGCGDSGSSGETESTAGETESTGTTGNDQLDDSVILLSPTDRLVRIAMALKGTRPSLDEIAAVQVDPDALGGIVDEYLDSPEFGETIRDLENQTLLMRVESMVKPTLLADVVTIHTSELAHLYFEEPLRLIEDVVMNDLPYSEIVTSKTTMSSWLGPHLWAGLEDSFDPEGPEWQRLGYTDGRPTAGILSTGGWNRRYASANANRHREGAASAADSLLCTSYSDRDIPLGSVDLTDNNAVDDAILNNPTCVSCHQTLDPLAGFFFGFPARAAYGNGFPLDIWIAENAGTGAQKTGRENGYYGLGGETMTDLGALIAVDNRFTACTARRYISYLSQVPRGAVPIGAVADAQRVLVESDQSIKEMVRSIVLSDRFAVSHSTDADEAEGLVGYLQTRPEQLSRMFAELTGFTWETRLGGPMAEAPAVIDVLTNSDFGFRVHGGGLDNVTKVVPVHRYSAHASAFLRNLAAEAAGAVTEADFEVAADQRKLLRHVEADTTDEAAVREQLAFLHLRVLAEIVATDSPEVDESYALFTSIQGMTGDVPLTWKIVLTALFQDFRVAYH